jgi:hypothetical protein
MSAELPKLPDEVWRGAVKGHPVAVCDHGNGAYGMLWWEGKWTRALGAAEDRDILCAWGRSGWAQASRLAAEGDAMRNTALLALAEETDPAAALRAILAVPRACRTCGRVVEPARQCYAIPTCYACLPPPPPLQVAEVP